MENQQEKRGRPTNEEALIKFEKLKKIAEKFKSDYDRKLDEIEKAGYSMSY